MTTPLNGKPHPKWVIDLHGIKEALTTRSNARSRVIDAIQSGEMLIIRSVSDELKAIYPDLWPDFSAIKPKKYLTPPMSTVVIAAQLQETHGSPLLGGVPDFKYFEAIAAARSEKCKLVSAAKALSQCKSIAKKCGLPDNDIIPISYI